MKSRTANSPLNQSRLRHRGTAAMVSLGMALVPLGLVAVTDGPAQAATKIPATGIAPRGVTLSAGSNATVSLLFASSRPSTTRFSVEGLPAGVSSEVGCSSARNCAVLMRAATNAPEATALVEIVLRAGTTSRRIPFALHIKPLSAQPAPVQPTTPAPSAPGTGRTLSLRPSALITTVRPGERATFTVNIVRNGWTGPVDMVVESLPSNWRAAYIPNPSSSDLSTLILDTPAGTASGDYPIRISGRSGALVAESTLVVRLRNPQVSLTLLAAGPAVVAGTSSRYVLDVRSVDDPTRPVTVTVEGLPSGATAFVAPNPAIGNVTVDVNVTAAVGQAVYGFTFVANSGGTEVRLPAVLTVTTQATATYQFQPTAVTPVVGESTGYGLSSSSTSLLIARNVPSSFDVTVSPKGGFVAPISVSLTTPNGWSVAWSPVSANVFRVTLIATTNAAVGTTSLVLNTGSGNLTASLTLSATVS